MEGLPCKARAQASATTAQATALRFGLCKEGKRMRGGLGGSVSDDRSSTQSVSGPLRKEGRPGGVATSPSRRLREGVTGGER